MQTPLIIESSTIELDADRDGFSDHHNVLSSTTSDEAHSIEEKDLRKIIQVEAVQTAVSSPAVESAASKGEEEQTTTVEVSPSGSFSSPKRLKLSNKWIPRLDKGIVEEPKQDEAKDHQVVP
jgi:hypothetical protein